MLDKRKRYNPTNFTRSDIEVANTGIGVSLKKELTDSEICQSSMLIWQADSLTEGGDALLVGGNDYSVNLGSGLDVVYDGSDVIADLEDQFINLETLGPDAEEAGQVIEIDGDSGASSIRLAGTSGLMSPDRSWWVNARVKISDLNGTVWAKRDLTGLGALGVFGDGTNLKTYKYATTDSVIEATPYNDRLINIITYFDAPTKQLINVYEQLGYTVQDLSGEELVQNDCDITINVYFGTDDPDDNIYSGSMGSGSRVHSFAYGEQQLDISRISTTGEEVTKRYFNPFFRHLFGGIGGSNLQGIPGKSAPEYRYSELIRAQFRPNNIEFINQGLGGTKFYQGLPDGTTKPEFVTGVRLEPTVRNSTRVARMGCYAMLESYPVSWLIVNYTEGPNVWSEKIWGLEVQKDFCEQNGMEYYIIAPFPVGATYDASFRADLLATSQKMLELHPDVCIDQYSWAADPATNLCLSEYNYIDDLHKVDAFDARLFIELKSDIGALPYVIPAINIGGPDMYISTLPSFSAGRPVATFNNDYVQTMLSCYGSESTLYLEFNGYFYSDTANSTSIYTEYAGAYDSASRSLMIFKSGTGLIFRAYSATSGYRQLEHSAVVFDDYYLHKITMREGDVADTIDVTIDGITENLDLTVFSRKISDRSEIGRQPGYETKATMWDVTICDTLIPLDEQSGTNRYDSDGNLIGSLTQTSPDTYYSKWLRYSDMALVDTPTIEPNPDDNATLQTLLGVGAGDILTQEEWMALNNASTIFINQDNGMRVNIYSVAKTGYDEIRSIRWVGNALIPLAGYYSYDFSDIFNSFYIGML